MSLWMLMFSLFPASIDVVWGGETVGSTESSAGNWEEMHHVTGGFCQVFQEEILKKEKSESFVISLFSSF